jgi:hypothetical protein
MFNSRQKHKVAGFSRESGNPDFSVKSHLKMFVTLLRIDKAALV